MLRNIINLFGVGVFILGWLGAAIMLIMFFVHDPIFATQIGASIAIPIIICIVVGKIVVRVLKIDL